MATEARNCSFLITRNRDQVIVLYTHFVIPTLLG